MTPQNPTEYCPTPKEEILLEVLINPEYRMKSVTDICRIAKCDRSTYYEAFSKPGFVELYKSKSMDIVKQSVAPVLNTFVREALRGSYQHGKLILDMAGLVTEEQKARTDKLKAEAIKANEDETDQTEDDGFIDALSRKVDEIWQE